MLTDIWNAIAALFEKVFFLPFNALRFLEDESWWLANTMSWIFIIIGFVAFYYWMKQLQIFNDEGTEDRSIVGHSFLSKKTQS